MAERKSEFEALKELARSIGQPKKVEAPSPAVNKQKKPKLGKTVIHTLVNRDISAKVKAGQLKYGTKLMSGNGRDPLIDLYQELIDAVFYLRQLIEENGR
jgi:hypothetical protein